MSQVYDVIIIGGGPAGLSSALYAGRAKLSTLILEKEKLGGQIVTTEEVVNYPGSLCDEESEGTSGPKLIDRMVSQANHFGATTVMKGVAKVDFSKSIKEITTEDGTKYHSRAVIIATGASSKKLGFPGEAEFTGRGVSFCATCDADFFDGLEVFCIGAGYVAVEEAIYLTKFADKVTIIAREPQFTCAKSIANRALCNPKIEVKFNAEVVEVRGDGILEEATFMDNTTGKKWDFIPHEDAGTFGLFVFVGYQPATDIFKGHVAMDEWGYILTDENMATNIPGVYAGGDLRPKELRQVITATSDGAIASTSIEKYLSHAD